MELDQFLFRPKWFTYLKIKVIHNYSNELYQMTEPMDKKYLIEDSIMDPPL
jgi:hypothetical protein